MPILRGVKLPNKAKLSDYIDNNHESIRITGLKPGQEFDVDVTLDGGYKHPDQPVVAGWKSDVTGREGVHTALLTVADSERFTLSFTGKSEMQNSRGRGITISKSVGFTANDLYVRGARTAGISFHGCSGFTANRLVTIDTGNYQSAKGQGPNWPGSIKFEGCSDYTLSQPASIDHLGNGITATESNGGTWIEPFAYNVRGAQIYINAAPHHSVSGGIAIGNNGKIKPPAYVVNSEEENEGVSDGVQFDGCYSLDVSWALGFWGNEKKAGLVINDAGVTNSVLLSENDWKIHPNANVAKLDQDGTLYIKQGDGSAYGNLRTLAATVADLIAAHAEWAEIAAARAVLVAAFEALRKPVITAPPPIDSAVFAAWWAEGQERAMQQLEWFERGRTIMQ